jgi:hypothetical protein
MGAEGLSDYFGSRTQGRVKNHCGFSGREYFNMFGFDRISLAETVDNLLKKQVSER